MSVPAKARLAASSDTATIAVASPPSDRTDRAVSLWLFAVAALVFAMIVVGGATRLTDSGLSITEWKPILGAIPPLSEHDWTVAFAKYKEIPEYHLVNKGMSLDEFKVIFWWEWSHRFLGRFIGLAFALPFAVFWAMGALRPGLAPKLAGVLALGALQGAVGWYMVSSGLVDRVDVSHYRLALHLGIAFVLLALLVWLALDVRPRATAIPRASLSVRRLSIAAVALIMAQVVLGAFVAGLKGGLVHNTWPLMDGELFPDTLFAMSPWWVNFVENPALAQFDHRLVAYLLLGVGAWLHAHVLLEKDRPRIASSGAVLLAIVLQAALGIWTLLAAVPLGLGLVHQGGAAIVLALATWNLHRAVRP